MDVVEIGGGGGGGGAVGGSGGEARQGKICCWRGGGPLLRLQKCIEPVFLAPPSEHPSLARDVRPCARTDDWLDRPHPNLTSRSSRTPIRHRCWHGRPIIVPVNNTPHTPRHRPGPTPTLHIHDKNPRSIIPVIQLRHRTDPQRPHRMADLERGGRQFGTPLDLDFQRAGDLDARGRRGCVGVGRE